MKPWILLAALSALLFCTEAFAGAHWDIVVYNTSTKQVLRIPVWHLRKKPDTLEFAKIMLRERKRVGMGESVGYTQEGRFNKGDIWQGPWSQLPEKLTLPMNYPGVDANYQSPASFGGGD